MLETIAPKNSEQGVAEHVPRLNWEEILSTYRRAARGDHNARTEIILRLAQVADSEITINGGTSPEDERQGALLSIVETVDKRLALANDTGDNVHLFRKRFDSILYKGIASSIARRRTAQETEASLSLTDIWDFTSDDRGITEMSDRDALDSMLSQLTERQREILYDYYGFDGRTPKTFTEIASGYKVTKEAVNTSARRALDNLRKNPDIELFRD
jgi:hypothetical protein